MGKVLQQLQMGNRFALAIFTFVREHSMLCYSPCLFPRQDIVQLQEDIDYLAG